MSDGDDYDKLLKSKARRALAWDALRTTRNPEYVAVRYNYPVKTMRDALAKIPETETVYQVLQKRKHPLANTVSGPTRARDLLPETCGGSSVPKPDDE